MIDPDAIAKSILAAAGGAILFALGWWVFRPRTRRDPVPLWDAQRMTFVGLAQRWGETPTGAPEVLLCPCGTLFVERPVGPATVDEDPRRCLACLGGRLKHQVTAERSRATGRVLSMRKGA